MLSKETKNLLCWCLAANCDTGNIKGFRKCIKNYNTGQIAYSTASYFDELSKAAVHGTNEKTKLSCYCQKDINTNEMIVIAAEIHEAISTMPRNKANGNNGLMLELFQFFYHIEWK